jgi:hypothetical protein
MHDDYTSNLVACLRMPSMEFCEFIVTANKVAGMYRAKEQLYALNATIDAVIKHVHKNKCMHTQKHITHIERERERERERAMPNYT